MESFLVRKIKGSAFLGRFETCRVSLLEIIDGETWEFFKFVLHLKVVPSSATGVGTSHIILLDEKEVGQAIERYFSLKTGVGRNFPGIRDDQWHISPPWFDQVAENCLQGHILTRVKRAFPA